MIVMKLRYLTSDFLIKKYVILRIESDSNIQLLNEICAAISVRENAGSPHFHRVVSPFLQQPIENVHVPALA